MCEEECEWRNCMKGSKTFWMEKNQFVTHTPSPNTNASDDIWKMWDISTFINFLEFKNWSACSETLDYCPWCSPPPLHPNHEEVLRKKRNIYLTFASWYFTFEFYVVVLYLINGQCCCDWLSLQLSEYPQICFFAKLLSFPLKKSFWVWEMLLNL